MSKSKAVAKTSNKLEKWLEKDKTQAQIDRALGQQARKYWSAEQIAQKVLVAARRNLKLLEVFRKNKGSLLAAMQEAGQAGLDPSGVGDEGYLIPYGSTVAFVPGYKGVRKVMVRAGIFDRVKAFNVFQCEYPEHFSYDEGLERDINHTPHVLERPSDPDEAWEKIVCSYAIGFKREDGELVADDFIVVPRGELERIRNQVKSRAKNWAESPWKNWPERMTRKTAIKRLAKDQDAEADSIVQAAVSADDRWEAGEGREPVEADAEVVDSESESEHPFEGESGEGTSEEPEDDGPEDGPEERTAKDEDDYEGEGPKVEAVVDEIGERELGKRGSAILRQLVPNASTPSHAAGLLVHNAREAGEHVADYMQRIKGVGDDTVEKMYNLLPIQEAQQAQDEAASKGEQEPESGDNSTDTAPGDDWLMKALDGEWGSVAIEEEEEILSQTPVEQAEEDEQSVEVGKVLSANSGAIKFVVVFNKQKDRLECGCAKGTLDAGCPHIQALKQQVE